MPNDPLIEEYVEKGANLEHDRWARWQKYLHSLCIKNEDGSMTIPKSRVEHWERQIATPYGELSEQEKEYDRKETRNYLTLFKEYGDKRVGEVLSRVKELPTICGWCNKAGVNTFGECQCSYEESRYVKKSDVLSLITQKQ